MGGRSLYPEISQNNERSKRVIFFLNQFFTLIILKCYQSIAYAYSCVLLFFNRCNRRKKNLRNQLETSYTISLPTHLIAYCAHTFDIFQYMTSLLTSMLNKYYISIFVRRTSWWKISWSRNKPLTVMKLFEKWKHHLFLLKMSKVNGPIQTVVINYYWGFILNSWRLKHS